MIKAANLAIVENKHVVSQSHVGWCSVGDANDFLFGTTQWVRKSVVKEEFIKKVKALIGEDPISSNPITDEYRNERKIVWLFFSGSNDQIWLGGLDIDVEEEFPNSEVHDMQHGTLGRLLGRQHRKPQIGARDLFARLGFVVSGQHNGGNDAVYELRAFLAELALSSEQWRDLRNNYMLPRMTGE